MLGRSVSESGNGVHVWKCNKTEFACFCWQYDVCTSNTLQTKKTVFVLYLSGIKQAQFGATTILVDDGCVRLRIVPLCSSSKIIISWHWWHWPFLTAGLAILCWWDGRSIPMCQATAIENDRKCEIGIAYERVWARRSACPSWESWGL